jgi:hypothetical protein
MQGEHGGGERPLERLPSERLGGDAFRLSMALPPTFEEWEEGVDRVAIDSDRYTLYSMADFERLTRTFLFEDEMPRPEREKAVAVLSQHLAAYRAALPFTQEERRWMTRLCGKMENTPNIDERMRSIETPLVAAGHYRVVQAGDLFRRWWSWRRETDEYRNEHSISFASASLAAIAARFMRRPLPPELRGLEDEV